MSIARRRTAAGGKESSCSACHCSNTIDLHGLQLELRPPFPRMTPARPGSRSVAQQFFKPYGFSSMSAARLVA